MFILFKDAHHATFSVNIYRPYRLVVTSETPMRPRRFIPSQTETSWLFKTRQNKRVIEWRQQKQTLQCD